MPADAMPDDGALATTSATLSALAHPTRLRVWLRLAAAAPGGMPSGEIAATLGVPATTMSAHLAVLARAGLASTRREGKAVVYTAGLQPARRVAALLAEVAGEGP